MESLDILGTPEPVGYAALRPSVGYAASKPSMGYAAPTALLQQAAPLRKFPLFNVAVLSRRLQLVPPHRHLATLQTMPSQKYKTKYREKYKTKYRENTK